MLEPLPLPDFTPRDSHALWFLSSSRALPLPQPSRDSHHHHGDTAAAGPHAPGHARSRGHGHPAAERSMLARLRGEEQQLKRRRNNVQNFGSTWLRPPGLPKTLHQMREEKREQEEHIEALRREALQEELANAEAAAAAGGMTDEMQLDEAPDLDDEIPDAEDQFTLDADDDGDDDDGDDDGDNDATDDADDENQHAVAARTNAALREERQNGLIQARMRMTDDAFRAALVQGRPSGNDMYGGDDELDDESRGQLLDEDDLAHENDPPRGHSSAVMDMDANLDDDIPEADYGGYEHTDSDAGFSSSSSSSHSRDAGLDHGVDFLPRTARMNPQLSPTPQHGPRFMAPRDSMDLSNILSHDESSFTENSPTQNRR
ncbi:hypothetical protein CDD81_7662 [Ophiocordyceps australis]|uniref:Uncharacterized protein n=1 Tax=Ophiocordyceps australis TaxID=1399860 RepID=A0A2C5Y518_9HYPO|nr:hypothetical protein CDD81_7662 [Ophiocordyceps australis]